jgi:hypothetical protein
VWHVPNRDRHAKVAQSVEHSTENAGVGGSIPPLGTIAEVIAYVAASTAAAFVLADAHAPGVSVAGLVAGVAAEGVPVTREP